MMRWAMIALLVGGCAGQLEGDPRCPGPNCPDDRMGPAVDMCVVNTSALLSCQAAGCHGSTPLSAGLNLEAASVTTNAKSFLDRANVGTMNVTMPGDPAGCVPNMYKLVDSANAMNSLLYTKATAGGEAPMQPCGTKMPVIGTFTADNKACLLSWIQSVIALK